jgi:hypothetical protein
VECKKPFVDMKIKKKMRKRGSALIKGRDRKNVKTKKEIQQHTRVC